MANVIYVAVRDIKIGTMPNPFQQPNEEYAKRTFALAINDKQNPDAYKIRDDLELWKLAEYDTTSGRMNTKGMPCLLVNRGELVKKEEVD